MPGTWTAEHNKYEACIAFSPLWDVGNGETLCKDCHDETKQGRR